MSVEILQITPNEELSVNGKAVRKDMDGNWIAGQELNGAEEKFLKEYIQLIETVKEPVKATYKSIN